MCGLYGGGVATYICSHTFINSPLKYIGVWLIRWCCGYIYMQPHHNRINHTPMYFNGLF